MKIVKWKSIQQWTPPMLTSDQINEFMCNNWGHLPKDLLAQLSFSVQDAGLLNSERLVPYDSLDTMMIVRHRVRLDPKHNPLVNDWVTYLQNWITWAVKASEDEPIPVLIEIVYYMDWLRMGGSAEPEIWLFKGDVCIVECSKIESFYSVEQKALLVLELYDKDRRKWEQLRRTYKSDTVEEEAHHRERIPQDVRIAVWRRDGGKCARCGGRVKLEYDHIVPVSKGGSNTARNIELLCEVCNRKKSNNIA